LVLSNRQVTRNKVVKRAFYIFWDTFLTVPAFRGFRAQRDTLFFLEKIKENQVENCKNSSKNPILWGKNPKLLTKIKENQVENCQSSSKNPILRGKNPEFLTKIKENQVENCQNSSKKPILWGKNPEFLTTPPPLSRCQKSKFVFYKSKFVFYKSKFAFYKSKFVFFK
jgi:hypothetical protein